METGERCRNHAGFHAELLTFAHELLVFEVMGVNISSICKRIALTIEFLTPGTCTSHARIGKLAES